MSAHISPGISCTTTTKWPSFLNFPLLVPSFSSFQRGFKFAVGGLAYYCQEKFLLLTLPKSRHFSYWPNRILHRKWTRVNWSLVNFGVPLASKKIPWQGFITLWNLPQLCLPPYWKFKIHTWNPDLIRRFDAHRDPSHILIRIEGSSLTLVLVDINNDTGKGTRGSRSCLYV